MCLRQGSLSVTVNENFQPGVLVGDGHQSDISGSSP